MTDIAFKRLPSQQTHQQVNTEKTYDTGTKHPTGAKKAPHNFFPPDEEEEEEEAVPPTPLPLQQHQYRRKAPELVKVVKEDSSSLENITLTCTAVKQMYHLLLRRLLKLYQFHLSTNYPLEKIQKNNPVLKIIKPQVQPR